MRGSLLTVAALAAGCTIAGAINAPRGEAACAATVTWHDLTYMGYGDGNRAEAGRRLADPATEPGCSDVVINGAVPDVPDKQIAVRAIRGVSPMIAISGESSVYVNASTFVQLPSHPLHKLYGTGRPPIRTGPSCRVKGRAVVGQGAFGVKRGDETVRIRVASYTAVELQRYGTGYVPENTKIDVVGHSCKRNAGVLWMTAQRISRG
jgi:hypothetical protein